jgi:tetratricopeptide (TPR) repeat protein
MQGDLDRAAAFYAESLAIQRRLGDIWWIALLLNSLGDIARIQGCHRKALALFQEGLNLRRELGDPWGLAESLHNLGALAREQGECERAAALYAEALSLYCQVGDRWSCVECLEALAGIATTMRQCRRAARLFGAASTLVDAIDAPLTAHARSTHERDLAIVRATLGETAFAAAWRAGREMPLENICEEVRSLQDNDGELTDESVQLSVG